MRKLLLATTALVGGVAFAGAAHADAAPTAPITLNVGGYVDAVAGYYHEAAGVAAAGATTALPGNVNHDFETEYKINFDAVGKASNGIEYGANVSLWNGPEAQNLWTGGGNTTEVNSAYVWLSGAFGKAMFGDSHGASDLFVYAPTVGEGQVDGRYMDFTSPFTLARVYASGIDNTEHSTNITYYTPKIGNDMNKVQLGVTYEPNMYDYGSDVVKTNLDSAIPAGTSATYPQNFNGPSSPYKDVVKGAVAYTGNYNPVNMVLSAQINSGSHGATRPNSDITPMFAYAPSQNFKDYTAWGLGGQFGFAGLSGFTLGASYNDLGSYGAVVGQNKSQDVWSLGGKYEFNKIAVAASWLTGEQYDNLLVNGAHTTTDTSNYVSGFNAESVGAVYTWFPGLTTNADAVLFQQDVRDQADHNDGMILLVSQKMAF